MTKVTFTAAKYGNAVAKLAIAGAAVDKVAGEQAKTVNAWAVLAAAGLSANSLTLATIKEGLIAQHPKAATLPDCGNTIKGWFYAFQRVATANQLDRILNGEALWTVAKACKPKQEQKAGKRAAKSNGDKSKKLPSLNEAIAAVSHYLDAAMASTDKAKELAGNAALAEMIAKIGKVSSKAQGATAAKQVNKRKPQQPKVARVPRSATVVSMAA